ncbi:hypothetical protein [Fusibacter tunisiensis]|uniref:Uncharacterized protein n=1 Tax=Fusibacter tunisiensis TaxID=1008308 RepID=A0ABS2MN29_9FIRM|nr:hypothetical protein [Fusibacter tunisiensis]MBM7560793.1 hypothetical protein [Fusibacter tunisiensis]
MNGWALLGILMVVYAAFVVYIALKKPTKIWEMAKIKLFIRVLGEKGTEIFFIVFAAIVGAAGIWLIIR